jgi:AcrR family transcriptional regulator
MTPLSINPPIDADARRSQVLEVAAQVLAEDGPHGLSLRRIATQAGGSTQIVYTLFGGKPGLADALYAEGFRRLAARMTAALDDAPPVGDPQRLIALGEGYRRFASDEPAFFAVMFGRAVPGFAPARRTRALGREQTLGQVVTAAQECLDAGTLVAPDATTLARACWATAHGVAALEVAGMLAPEGLEDVARLALRAPVDAHRPPT